MGESHAVAIGQLRLDATQPQSLHLSSSPKNRAFTFDFFFCGILLKNILSCHSLSREVLARPETGAKSQDLAKTCSA